MNRFLTLLDNLKLDTLSKRIIFFVVLVLLFIFLIFADISDDKNTQGAPKKTESVLGRKFIPTPTQKLTPTPTSTIVAQRVVLPTATQTPTPTPTLQASSLPSSGQAGQAITPPTNTSSNTSPQTSTPTSTPTPTQAPIISTPTPTASPSATPTPTPQGNSVEISIDYAGQKTNDSYSINVEIGQNAWEAIKKAVGVENVQYTDYGGDLGIFITGFNGINATGNQYFEFRVNGVSSNVGVSSYICNNGDKLEFILTTF